MRTASTLHRLSQALTFSAIWLLLHLQLLLLLLDAAHPPSSIEQRHQASTKPSKNYIRHRSELEPCHMSFFDSNLCHQREVCQSESNKNSSFNSLKRMKRDLKIQNQDEKAAKFLIDLRLLKKHQTLKAIDPNQNPRGRVGNSDCSECT